MVRLFEPTVIPCVGTFPVELVRAFEKSNSKVSKSGFSGILPDIEVVADVCQCVLVQVDVDKVPLQNSFNELVSNLNLETELESESEHDQGRTISEGEILPALSRKQRQNRGKVTEWSPGITARKSKRPHK